MRRTPRSDRFWTAALGLGMLMLAAACGDSAESEPPAGVTVVATTTILGDVAGNVVGDGGAVEVLIPVGADPHDYRPSARQVAAVYKADLVISNGLQLEEGLLDVLEGAAADGANVLQFGDLVDPLPFGEADGSFDPHIWMDPARMADAARLIAVELAALDPSVDWQARSERYAAELLAADREAATILAAVPSGDRKLVTNHDSFGYFADRYGFEVVGVVVPGGATLAEPSSAELADLVQQVAAAGVPAIFAETTEPATLAEAVAAEAGTDIAVIELYTGSLGEPGSGADTLVGMLLTNARRIAGALS